VIAEANSSEFELPAPSVRKTESVSMPSRSDETSIPETVCEPEVTAPDPVTVAISPSPEEVTV